MTYASLMAYVQFGRPNDALLRPTVGLAERFQSGVAACRPIQAVCSNLRRSRQAHRGGP